MREMFGRTLHAGDVIVVGMRQGNSGYTELRVVLDPDTGKVKGLRGGTGYMNDDKEVVKLDTGQLQNELGYKLLDIAFKERQK